MNFQRPPYAWLTGAAATAFTAALLGAVPAHALPPTVRGPLSPGQTGFPETPGPELAEPGSTTQLPRTPFSKPVEPAPALAPAFSNGPSRTSQPAAPPSLSRTPVTPSIHQGETVAAVSHTVTPVEFTGGLPGHLDPSGSEAPRSRPAP